MTSVTGWSDVDKGTCGVPDGAFAATRDLHALAISEIKAALEGRLEWTLGSTKPDGSGQLTINVSSPHFPHTGSGINDRWRVAQLSFSVRIRSTVFRYVAHDGPGLRVEIVCRALGIEFYDRLPPNIMAAITAAAISHRGSKT